MRSAKEFPEDWREKTLIATLAGTKRPTPENATKLYRQFDNGDLNVSRFEYIIYIYIIIVNVNAT